MLFHVFLWLLIFTCYAAPHDLLANCKTVLKGNMRPSEMTFWQHVVGLCSVAEQHFDDRLIILFCANFYRYPVCKLVDYTLKQELRNGTHDAMYVVSDSMSFARDLHVTHFPALTQIIAGRLTPFLTKMNYQNIKDWLHKFNVKSIISINYTNFEDVVRNVDPTAIFMYRNGDGCMDAAQGRWWRNLVRSMYDMPVIQFASMDVNDWNKLIMRQRLHVDLSDRCPQLVIVSNYSYILFEKEILRRGVTDDIRSFISNIVQFSAKVSWRSVGEDLTDIEFQYEFMEEDAMEVTSKSKFIIIGVTGGIGVIALAVSIFWGLSSSAYTNDYQSLYVTTEQMQYGHNH
ncbi:unnamed protein product [Soboliphyme baturini]|uniref:Thioredoxin-like fold domain-containing protein n=1 Tax=Soboliphyme baturini TaxID=241478 RepID=A0A183J686_9BILA|nr:unnamed protein product [Soboliphyme baturini]